MAITFRTCLATALLLLAPAVSIADQHPQEAPMSKWPAVEEGRPIAVRAVVSRVFYSGTLNWYWQPSSIGSLSMRGFATSSFGGTVRTVTTCFYNESSFVRTFSATVEVRQSGRTVQDITFATTFAPQRHSCHTLNNFSAEVEPGEYEIVTTYDRASGDNFWAGLSSTDGGSIYDVQIGSSRPPFATGPQGPIQIRGVGIRYTIDENDEPPPPPPPPACEAPCLGERFSVGTQYSLQNGATGEMGSEILSSSTAAFYFTNSTNLELFVKVVNACSINNTYWVFASGLTNQGIVITIRDTATSTDLIITNPLGRLFEPFVATSREAGALSCDTN